MSRRGNLAVVVAVKCGVRRAVLVVGLALSVGCGDDDVVDAGAPTTATSVVDGSQGEGRLIACGGQPYSPSALEGPIGAEAADDAAAAALRELIANPSALDTPLPAEGWRRLYDEGGDVVVFGSGQPNATGGTGALVEVTLRDHGDDFAFSGVAYGCTPHVVVEGRSVAEFALAPASMLTPRTTSIEVLVTERACTGGMPVEDRLGPPDVHYAEDAVEVLFSAEPFESDYDTVTCQSNPPAEVTLELSGPLGDRQLLDASTYPPRDPAEAV